HIDRGKPVIIPPENGPQTPAQATSQTPPAAPTTTAPTTTLPPQPGDPAAAGTTGGLAPLGKHKKHKGALAGTETHQSSSRGTTPTGPVTPGVDPSTSSWGGDGAGAVDPGAPASCTATGAATGVDSGTAQAPTVVTSYERKSAKKRVRQSKARDRSPSAGGKGTARRRHGSHHG